MGPKSAKVNAYIIQAPLIGVIALGLLAQYLYMIPFLIGFGFFFQAKRSVIQGGNLISFGSARMSRKMKLYYWGGYAVMLSSVAMNGWLAYRVGWA